LIDDGQHASVVAAFLPLVSTPTVPEWAWPFVVDSDSFLADNTIIPCNFPRFTPTE
jgi:hypothetical protein